MAKKKEPTFKVRLEGFSGFTVREVQIQAAADGTAEIPEWLTSTQEFNAMVTELSLMTPPRRIANLGEVPEVVDAPEATEVPADVTPEPAAVPIEEAK